jgi:hypothetical protein
MKETKRREREREIERERRKVGNCICYSIAMNIMNTDTHVPASYNVRNLSYIYICTYIYIRTQTRILSTIQYFLSC